MATRAEKRFNGNLPQLQNLIKRDPETYKHEFEQQLRQFDSMLKILSANPNEDHAHFDSLIVFLAQVSFCYPTQAKSFMEQIRSFLKTGFTSISSPTRLAFCKALMLLHKRKIIEAEHLIPLFMDFLKSPDKHVRSALSSSLVTIVKAVNAKHKDQKLNSRLQNIFLQSVKEGHPVVSLIALESVIHLYKKNTWREAKAVNIIADACVSDLSKLNIAAVRFFTGVDEEDKKDDDEDSDSEVKTAKELLVAHRVGKKTNKRQKRLDRGMRQIKKAANKNKKEIFDFSALHLIYDTQGFTEKLYKKLEKSNEQFETKLLFMDLISRLIGVHKLLVLNFYPYIQRFLQPHQREVTRILLFTAQSMHDLVPPDVAQTLVKLIADNFIAERNSSEVIAVGLNSIREVCGRCSFAMTNDLLKDLALYRKYHNKNVVSAARSLIQLYRHIDPSMLHRRDRGKPTEATTEAKLKQYGETTTAQFVTGAELLPDDENEDVEDLDEWQSESEESEDDDDEWVDVNHDDEEEATGVINDEVNEMTAEEKAKKAELVSTTRLLTQKDFDVIKKQQYNAILGGSSKGKKRTATAAFGNPEPREFVSLSDIERLAKKPKETKAEKIARTQVDRTDRGAFGRPKPKLNPHASTTNKQKNRQKNFMMIRQKVRGKQKRSFRDKQIAFRAGLTKQLKRK